MTYLYYDLGASQKRDDYQYEILGKALEKTRAEYGDYQLIKVKRKFTSMRARREVSRGEIINIEGTPHPASRIHSPGEPDDSITSVNKPLLEGLLGYRKVVIRRKDAAKFNALKTADELRQLIAGQGKDWEDNAIYKANGYRLEDDADFYTLFAMLAAGRFDYIPLSVIEVENMLERFPKYNQDLMIVPDIIIYYPLPVVFNVSNRDPKLAERVEKGLSLAEADGTMKTLFEFYFAEELAKLKQTHYRVFILKNPHVPDDLNMSHPKLLDH